VKKLLLPALVAVLSAAGVPASAAVSASASITNLTFTLFDLNPGDGIDPGITFVGGESGGTGSLISAGGGTVPFGALSGSQFGVASGAASNGTTTGSFSVSSTSLSASGAVQFTGAFDVAAFSGSGSTVFRLTPFTTLSISGLATVTVTTDGIELGGVPESGKAVASISISGPAAGGGQGFQQATDSRTAEVSPLLDIVVPMVSGSVGVAFVNLTNATMEGNLVANVSVLGQTPAVPEPSTWALAGLGLLGVGAVVRKRRKA
jgi:hypothetical protein